MHSSPKFSLPHHLLTAGLFQEFLFCLYSTYLCALESTSLPCLLATLRWCWRDRENSVFNSERKTRSCVTEYLPYLRRSILLLPWLITSAMVDFRCFAVSCRCHAVRFSLFCILGDPGADSEARESRSKRAKKKVGDEKTRVGLLVLPWFSSPIFFFFLPANVLTFPRLTICRWVSEDDCVAVSSSYTCGP